jgi:MFS family permease
MKQASEPSRQPRTRETSKKHDLVLLLTFFLTIALNTAAMEAADVVATSSYLSNLGTNSLPLLWTFDMVVILLSSFVYSLIIDKFTRFNLMRGFILISGTVFFLLWVLVKSNTPPEISYTLLYILIDQQIILFPLTFWALANESYNLNESKQTFPLIAAGGMTGNVLGNWLASLSSSFFLAHGWSNDDVLIVCSVVIFTTVIILMVGASKRAINQSRRAQSNEKINLKESWTVGMDFVRNVPLFRYLAIVVFLVELLKTFVEYHFLVGATTLFPETTQFQTFFGMFKAVLTIVSLVLQIFLAGKLLEKLGHQGIFFILPAILAAGALTSTFLFSPIAAIAIFLGVRSVFNSIDEPARRSIHGLVPEARRGRVSTFIDSYVYATGSIAGCIVLGITILLQQYSIIDPTILSIVFQAASFLLALVVIVFVQRLRKSYHTSMLNWRIARRQHRSRSVQHLLDL